MIPAKIGLGDLAYVAFRPFVYIIDWFWGTDMRHCEVCKARRSRWNDQLSVSTWFLILLTVSLIAFAWL